MYWLAASVALLASVARAQIFASLDPSGVAASGSGLVVGSGTQAVAAAVAPEALPSAPLRDPFWPVGYVPRRPEKPAAAVATRPNAGPAPVVVPVAVSNPVDWDEARRHLEIRGISRIARDKTSGRAAYFAVINNKMVEEGEAVSVPWNGRVYRWRVTQIGPAGLQLVKIDTRAE